MAAPAKRRVIHDSSSDDDDTFEVPFIRLANSRQQQSRASPVVSATADDSKPAALPVCPTCVPIAVPSNSSASSNAEDRMQECEGSSSSDGKVREDSILESVARAISDVGKWLVSPAPAGQVAPKEAALIEVSQPSDDDFGEAVSADEETDTSDEYGEAGADTTSDQDAGPTEKNATSGLGNLTDADIETAAVTREGLGEARRERPGLFSDEAAWRAAQEQMARRRAPRQNEAAMDTMEEEGGGGPMQSDTESEQSVDASSLRNLFKKRLASEQDATGEGGSERLVWSLQDARMDSPHGITPAAQREKFLAYAFGSLSDKTYIGFARQELVKVVDIAVVQQKLAKRLKIDRQTGAMQRDADADADSAAKPKARKRSPREILYDDAMEYTAAYNAWRKATKQAIRLAQRLRDIRKQLYKHFGRYMGTLDLLMTEKHTDSAERLQRADTEGRSFVQQLSRNAKMDIEAIMGAFEKASVVLRKAALAYTKKRDAEFKKPAGDKDDVASWTKYQRKVAAFEMHMQHLAEADSYLHLAGSNDADAHKAPEFIYKAVFQQFAACKALCLALILLDKASGSADLTEWNISAIDVDYKVPGVFSTVALPVSLIDAGVPVAMLNWAMEFNETAVRIWSAHKVHDDAPGKTIEHLNKVARALHNEYLRRMKTSYNALKGPLTKRTGLAIEERDGYFQKYVFEHDGSAYSSLRIMLQTYLALRQQAPGDSNRPSKRQRTSARLPRSGDDDEFVSASIGMALRALSLKDVLKHIS